MSYFKQGYMSFGSNITFTGTRSSKVEYFWRIYQKPREDEILQDWNRPVTWNITISLYNKIGQMQSPIPKRYSEIGIDELDNIIPDIKKSRPGIYKLYDCFAHQICRINHFSSCLQFAFHKRFFYVIWLYFCFNFRCWRGPFTRSSTVSWHSRAATTSARQYSPCRPTGSRFSSQTLHTTQSVFCIVPTIYGTWMAIIN